MYLCVIVGMCECVVCVCELNEWLHATIIRVLGIVAVKQLVSLCVNCCVIKRSFFFLKNTTQNSLLIEMFLPIEFC